MPDALWLATDIAVELSAPLQGRPEDRSPATLRAVVEQFEFGTAQRYAPRDIDHDGKRDTTCNIAAHDVTRALGCEIPRQRANDMFGWLLAAQQWTQLRAWVARELANAGFPVVAAWQNSAGPGHIAILVPSRNELDKHDHIFIAQTGATCFNYGRLENGFGSKTPSVAFFAHP
jgi:hypothetical protein